MAHPGSARTHVSSRGASILLGARELSLSSPEPAAARGSLGPLARPPKAALRARRRRLTRVPAGVLSPRLDLRRTRAPFCLATPRRARCLSSPFGERGPPVPARGRSLCAAARLETRHRMRQDYPLNLSISLSGGEETNQDAPSNGE